MDRYVETIFLEYGDARINFFDIHLKGTATKAPYLHSHCYYEFHFFTGEAFDCHLQDRSITLKQNEFILIPPNLLHRTEKTPGIQGQHFVISMTISQRKGLVKFYDTFVTALQGHVLMPLPFTDQLKEQALSVFAQKQLYRTVLGICKLKAAAAELVSWLFSQLLADNNASPGNEDNNVVLIDNLINRPEITLDEIASATNYSKRHVSRLIKQRYGSSISELRDKKKIQRSEEG